MSTCVLIVDSEPAVRSIAVDILSEAGFDTIPAADAGQALQVLTQETEGVDVLLTDVRIPGGMNGLELARVAKRKRPNIGVVVTSGYFAADFDSAGVLRKPWSASELVERVKKAVAR